MNFCKYKDFLGKPNDGIHKYRIFDIAIIDVLLTILISIFISILINKNIFIIFSFLFIFGQILHLTFCVDTSFIKFIKSFI